ncbi:cupin domain-containing protein [Frigidibacter sp. MR17.24]|uniref:cupin domain-containing protein n=1 Tax=Frigidibacter sp. MR17.24 TaxID=3127345 RepID=UPI003012FCC1
MARRLDLSALPRRTGSGYPAPFRDRVAGRSSLRLGAAGGLTQFGVNLIRLEPGALSSVRHWHEREDEFLWVTEGTLVMITEDGEETLGPGDCVAFPAGRADGHHLHNRGPLPASVLVVGSAIAGEVVHYPDDDLLMINADGENRYHHRDGTPWDPAP